MRTLHIDTGMEMRGGQRQVLLLLEGLAARGQPFSVLARSGGKLQKAVRARGWKVKCANLPNVFRLSLHADIVHAHDARAHTLAAIASRKPFVVSRRVVFPIRTSAASQWKYRCARAYLAISRAVARELEAAGVPAGKISVVYDAVASSGCPWHWSPGAPVVTPASNDPAKGGDLVCAASDLEKTIPVVFSHDLARDLPDASAFLYVSRSEGLGSAALLAMSMGVPVVASRVGGLAEVFEDEVSGLFVANDPPAILAAIRRITGDRELAERLSRQGRLRVERQFTPEALVEQTMAVYRSVL